MKENITVRIVDQKYVRDNFAQIMISYKKNLTIISKNDILYHDSSDNYQNGYIKDERKKDMPYSNIPFHIEQKMFNKINVINQIYDFDTHYLVISDNNIYCNYILRNEGIVYLISYNPFNSFVSLDSTIELLFLEDYLRNLPIDSYIVDNMTGDFVKTKKLSEVSSFDITVVSIVDSKLEYSLMKKNNKKLYYFPFFEHDIDIEQIKQQSFKSINEPKIDLKLNPSIKKDNIEKSKKKVLK